MIRTIALAVIVIALGFWLVQSQKQAPLAAQPTAVATYACSGNKTISVSFYTGPEKAATSTDQPPIPGGSAVVQIGDGRTLTLPQTISADGARYATADDSFVFWDKGTTALLTDTSQPKPDSSCIKVAAQPEGGIPLPHIYANSANGFSIRLGDGYTVSESYRYQELGPGKDISGIKFTIPATLATGTNLSVDSYLSVERIPQTGLCSAALFLEGTTTQTVMDGSTTYSVASSTGAAAGNRYNETVYAIPGTSPCIAVRYYIHYGVFQNYPAGTVTEFDEHAILNEFDAIRRSLIVVQ